MKQMLHTKALVVKDSVGASQAGVIDSVIGSTAVLDRMGDIIDQAGWDLKDYTNNPVILWGHNIDEERPPIAKALKVWVDGKGTKDAKLMFRVMFDLADSFAADIYRKIKEGFINTVSVGFMPTEWEELEPGNFWGGLRYTAQQLLELSFVPVPANPQALVGLRSFAKEDKRFTPIEETKLFRPLVDKKVLAEIFHKKEADVEVKAEDVAVDTSGGVDEEGNVVQGNGGGGSKDNIDNKPDGSADEPAYGANDMLGELQVKDFRAEMEGMLSTCAKTAGYKSKAAGEGNLDVNQGAEKDPFQAGQGMGDLAEMPADNMVVKDMTVGHTRALMQDVMGDWMSNLDTTSNQGQDTNDYAFTEGETKEEKLRKAKGLVSLIEKAGRVLSGKNENLIKDAIASLQQVISELEKEEAEEQGEPDAGKSQEEIETKGVIPYTDCGKAPESETWDGPGEMAKATEPADWKAMCAWFDSSKPDNKGSYKLPHHKGDGSHACVWRGVAAAMASLLGARGGVSIPEGDRKGVYNHLVGHYKEFDKEAPEFKAVEDQVLAGYDEEVLALILDREEKHITRLIKKVLENQKEEKRTVKQQAENEHKEFKGLTEDQVEKALSLIDLALTKVSSTSSGGGEK